MNADKISDVIKTLQTILSIAGNLTISQAVTWLEVKENAIRLKNEGHDPPEVKQPQE